MADVRCACRSSLALILTVASAAVLSLAVPAPAAAAAPGELLPGPEVALPATPLPPTDAYLHTADGRIQVLVELANVPAARAWAAALASSRGTKAQALTSARAAAKASMAAIASAQQKVAGMIAARPAWRATEVYRVGRALNAISYFVAPAAVDALRRLPGVRAVHLVEAEYPSNFTSVPFIGAPQLWGNTLSLPSNITGAGVRIGIIDTGIDYQHPMFGGSGLLADYQANDRVTISPSLFPTAKVVGGTDFAGDAYTGANAPVPDPNPTDCNDHGSHVAGTAAGFGVQSDGTTYPGPFDPSTPFNSLRIGPGVAPGALLYSLRVFGCKGSTGLVVQAIDWAIDPDGDADFSDHLDVINMSLGSNFGTLSSTSAMAAENASLVGVIVAAASGNAGDTYFITSSPAVSGRSLSVAAIADPGVPGAVLNVTAPPAIVGGYAALPDAFGNGAPSPSGQSGTIVLVQAGSGTPSQGCSAYTNAAAVAGNIALIDRGTCTFQLKAAQAQSAGAIAAIIVNNVPGDPNLTLMGPDNTQPNITIPAVMISFNDGATIKGQLPGVTATLAAATAADTVASFSSRGPRIESAHVRLKPDVAAPGLNIISTQSGMTCMTGGGCITPTANGFDPGGLSLTISGTSMATPHIAGSMALLRQLHPDWSVEELKALLMGGALHDLTVGSNATGAKYGPGRIGAGREDLALSAPNLVTAFNADEPGLVTLSFDREVVSSSTQVKTVRLVNHGAADQAFNLGFDLRNSEPGVSFSLPGGSTITVPAGGSVTFGVEMDANASLMTHLRDPTVGPLQLDPTFGTGNQPRHFLTEEAGYLTFSQSSQVVMHLPLYSAVRAASSMAGSSPIATGGNPSGSTNVTLTGTPVCTGTLSSTCTGTFPADEVSLVTPLELQAVHAQNPAIPAYANLQYAGVAYDAVHNLLIFGASTWGTWSTPNQVSINFLIDPTNSGSFTRVLFDSSPGQLSGAYFGSGAAGQDPFFGFRFNTSTNGISALTYVNGTSAAGIDSRVLDNSALVMTATPAQLALSSTIVKWKVQTCPGSDPLCLGGPPIDTISGPLSWDYTAGNQGLNFAGARLLQDLPGATIPVTFNTANIATNGSLGALLIHHHNAVGTRAQAIPVEGTASADLTVSKSMAPAAPPLNSNAVFTVTVRNLGPGTATGVVVADLLPAGLTYVSDDGAGSYSSASGLWTLPSSLGAGQAATLHVTATVTTTDPVDNVASIAAVGQLDPNPANNQATVHVNAPHSADLAVTMLASAPVVLSGGPVTFTVNVKNNGPDTSYGVAVNVTFPGFPGLAIVGNTETAGVFNGGTGLWSIASIANGMTETLTVTVNAPSTTGPFSAQAVATSTTADPNSADNTASQSVAVGLGFYTLTPCRLLDTRNPDGAFGGPALAAQATRVFTGRNFCGVPSDATGLSVNITVTGGTTGGDLQLYASDIAAPGTLNIAWSTGQTRANNAIVSLCNVGTFTVLDEQATGTVNFIVDVNGYFK
ncbi:MAG TPA: S8 family serine peptidase [Thermoanaerobaculia bacterium]|jgi:uncharacterized repeat protein (TIGR01451 family)|nr:S8 family serine peptidase [Thermoanaerobaculia bacterium]